MILVQKATDSTPHISFNPYEGSLIIAGRSIPENPEDTYRPILERIVEYLKNPADKTSITLDFEYLNTSSMKWVFHLLEKFERSYLDDGHSVEVLFYYSDEDMMDTGKYLQTNMVIPVDLLKK